MQVRNLLLLGFLAFIFTACADTPIRVISPEESAMLGFNVSGESILENPPENKTRIYVVRESGSLNNFFTKYLVYYLYDSPNMYKDEKGAFRIKDEVRKEIIEKSKNNLMGSLSIGTKLFEDFEADKPLLFRIASKGRNSAQLAVNRINWFFGDEEGYAFYLFTPKAGKIYCFLPVTYFSYSKYAFVDRQTCEKIYR